MALALARTRCLPLGALLLVLALSTLAPVTAAQADADGNTTTDGDDITDEPVVDVRDLEPPSADNLVAFAAVVIATVVLFLVLYGMARARRVMDARIRKWDLGVFGEFHLWKLRIQSRHWIRQGALSALRVVHLVLIVAGVSVYVIVMLAAMPWTQPWYDHIEGFLLNSLNSSVNSFLAYLPDLGYILVVVFLTWLPLKVIHGAFDAVAAGRIVVPGFYRSWATPTYKLVRFVILVFAFILVFPRLPGAGTTAFQGVSLFVGALITLGASSAIANAIAGIVLTYTRAFERGDRVQLATTTGDVVDRTLFVTRVRTNKNVVVTVPNALVLNSHIINYSRLSEESGIILHTQVGIGYDVPWRKVNELLLAAAKGVKGVNEKPAPFVHQSKLDDFSVLYELNVYTNEPERTAAIMSDLHEGIQDSFARAGVEIMSPHYRSVRDGNKTTVPEAPHPHTPKPVDDGKEVVLADEDAIARADERAGSGTD